MSTMEEVIPPTIVTREIDGEKRQFLSVDPEWYKPPRYREMADAGAEYVTLYHGTTAAAVPGIIKTGELRPRGKRKGNYDEKLQSNPDLVYLTDVYAHAFADIAYNARKRRPVIVELEVELSRVIPDTDYTEEGVHSWKFTDGLECLRVTGCCAVKGAVKVTRVYHCHTPWWREHISDKGYVRIECGVRHSAFYRTSKQLLFGAMWWSDRDERIW